MRQVRFSGLGGQGIVLMGEILGEAAVLDKKYVGQISSYGAEARAWADGVRGVRPVRGEAPGIADGVRREPSPSDGQERAVRPAAVGDPAEARGPAGHRGWIGAH